MQRSLFNNDVLCSVTIIQPPTKTYRGDTRLLACCWDVDEDGNYTECSYQTQFDSVSGLRRSRLSDPRTQAKNLAGLLGNRTSVTRLLNGRSGQLSRYDQVSEKCYGFVQIFCSLLFSLLWPQRLWKVYTIKQSSSEI